jgi:hypothetical protein
VVILDDGGLVPHMQQLEGVYIYDASIFLIQITMLGHTWVAGLLPRIQVLFSSAFGKVNGGVEVRLGKGFCVCFCVSKRRDHCAVLQSESRQCNGCIGSSFMH